MAQFSIVEINIDAGGVFSYDPAAIPDVIFLKTSGNPIAGDVTFQLDTPLSAGQSFKVFIPFISAGGFNLDVFGEDAKTPTPAAALGWVYAFFQNNTGSLLCVKTPLDFTDSAVISGLAIQQGTITLDKLTAITSGRIIVGNGSNQAAQVALSGDATITNAGALIIAANAIINSKIAANAAIDRSKLASGTPNYVVYNSGTGALTEAAYLPKALGGFGQSLTGATGIVVLEAGNFIIGAMNDHEFYNVSFETGEQCNNTFTIGHPCTLTRTNSSAFVTKAIAATDNAIITIAKNGTPIATGTITFAAGAALNAAGTIGAFADTQFSAGDTISLITSKPTAGGKANVTLQFNRLK